MSYDKIQTDEGTFRINQGIGDLKQGIRQDDLSRFSVYGGNDQGGHFGNNSPTIGRHGQPFNPLNDNGQN